MIWPDDYRGVRGPRVGRRTELWVGQSVYARLDDLELRTSDDPTSRAMYHVLRDVMPFGEEDRLALAAWYARRARRWIRWEPDPVLIPGTRGGHWQLRWPLMARALSGA
jgi:hypothetical protein